MVTPSRKQGWTRQGFLNLRLNALQSKRPRRLATVRQVLLLAGGLRQCLQLMLKVSDCLSMIVINFDLSLCEQGILHDTLS